MMRLRFERFRLHSPGAVGVLRSRGVLDDLVDRAERVKASADAELVVIGYPSVIVNARVGAGRANVTVGAVPIPLERSRRILGAAMDAAGN